MGHEDRIPKLDEGGIPIIDDYGIRDRRPICQSVPDIPHHIAQERAKPMALASWQLNLITYNCTTLKKEIDRQIF